MSLFPAYSNQIADESKLDENVENQDEERKEPQWLRNSSYQQISVCLHSLAESDIWTDSDEEPAEVSIVEETIDLTKGPAGDQTDVKAIRGKKRKRKKFKVIHEKSRPCQYESKVENVYFEERTLNRMFCTLETLESGLRPRYKKSDKRLGVNFKHRFRDKHFQRYHMNTLDVPKKLLKANKIPKLDEDDVKETNEIDQSAKYKLQNEQKMVVEGFNKKLAEYPKDISTWLEYVAFQDQIAEFSPFYSKEKNLKQLMNQKKLSIVEKALAANRDSIELLRMKLTLMSEILPADQFSDEIEAMVQRDPKNILLWQALITLVQTSCALCKISRVLGFYVKCFPILKQRSRSDPKSYDQQVLGLLYRCLTFLRHAGLWEQMWEIIRLNFCLNLALDHEMLKNVATIDEKTLMDMEEVILTSQLPLDQLWLRVESLRETCHWTGIDPKTVDINLIGDDRRLVSAEETNDFIYPTISRDSNFRIVILFLLCLKVPLLPCRHSSLKDFNLDDLYWSVDSIESVLPMIYPSITTGGVDERLSNETVISQLLEGKLISGPQFLKYHPAQEKFLDFIRSVFELVSHALPTPQRNSILVWWLKFERLLVFISKSDSLKDKSKNKKLKSMLKSFLKRAENRNNLHFYREFALIEYELGSVEGSIQLLKTIIQSQDAKSLETNDIVALFSLYKTVFGILLSDESNGVFDQNTFDSLIETLKNDLRICFSHTSSTSVQEMLYNEVLKFLTNPVTDEKEDEFILPNIFCDLLMCHAYLTYHADKEDLNDILGLFEKCLMHTEKCPRLQERLYETKILFLQFCQSKDESVSNHLPLAVSEALEKFPNNFFFLPLNALIVNELPHWKIKTKSKKLSVWSTLATCLAGRARITYYKNLGYDEALSATVNKMLACHRIFSKTPEVQSCPLVWRFYMLLLRDSDLCEKKGEEVYYEAVSQCPWARNVYISAAEIAPQILSQIQDLIKEKELRLHVTPEELEILRE
ncbi:hypothetical protein QAD02_010971 [Eretmocerus hayati]|uniref:Uncharacterized protein n=1 Tax=Eretmocerus hayati TaxID=131215 RepID=A0ACC2NVG1_9HYME|nr:hypothetical protein QAD02_010971 [Eretmocerus hayati]